MKLKAISVLLFVTWLVPACYNNKNEKLTPKISGKVIRIRDGDSIDILYHGKPFSVRLEHIDCPELKRNQPFGKAAKQLTSQLCFGQIVTVENQNKFDRYHRLIGIIITPGGDTVNLELIKQGLAWHYKRYSSDRKYAELELKARSGKYGLWEQEAPVPPWDWR